MFDFDDSVPLIRNQPNKFGDTFCLSLCKHMPLTVVKLVSYNGQTSDVLCHIDMGAEGSSFFEKHLNGIHYTKSSKPIKVYSSTSNVYRSKISGFSIVFEVVCPKTKLKYSIATAAKELAVTLQKDVKATETDGGLRWIFGNLGRDIILHNNAEVVFGVDKILLTRELAPEERMSAASPYPSLTGISLKDNHA